MRGTHYLKTWPRFFTLLHDGSKTFDVRRDDRDFAPGDEVVFCEWDPDRSAERVADGYTGRELRGRVRACLRAGDLPEEMSGAVGDDYVVMSVEVDAGSFRGGRTESGIDQDALDRVAREDPVGSQEPKEGSGKKAGDDFPFPDDDIPF